MKLWKGIINGLLIEVLALLIILALCQGAWADWNNWVLSSWQWSFLNTGIVPTLGGSLLGQGGTGGAGGISASSQAIVGLSGQGGTGGKGTITASGGLLGSASFTGEGGTGGMNAFTVATQRLASASLTGSGGTGGEGTISAHLVIAVHETTEATGGTTSLVCNKPANVVSGNLLVAGIGYLGNHNATWPSGWVEDAYYYVSADGWTVAVGHLIAGGSEPSTYTWTCPGGTFNEVIITRADNNATTSPVDTAVASTLSSGSSSSYTFDTIITATNNELIIYVASNHSQMTATWPVATLLYANAAYSISDAYEVKTTAGTSTARVINWNSATTNRSGVIAAYKSGP